MSKQIFDPLVALQQKPEITNIPIVNIRFPGNQPIQKMEGIMEEGEKQSKQMVKIVHKRKGPEYRNQILERLLQNANLPFVKVAEEIQKTPVGVISKEEKIAVEPIKKGKRLVIRDVTIPQIKEKEIIEEKIPEIDVEKEDEDFTELEKEIEEKLEQKPAIEVAAEPVVETEPKPAVEEAVETEAEPEPEKKKRGRKPKLVIKEPPKDEPVDLTAAVIRTQKVADRLPKEKERIVIPTSNFYMNNRKLFIQKIGEMLKSYRQEIMSDKEEITCDSFTSVKSFDLLTHQKIARDYLNLYTPYRGLLLYLGLGSGKCHKKNTPIMMHDGSIKMVQDILEGELLMGDDSTPRTVTSC